MKMIITTPMPANIKIPLIIFLPRGKCAKIYCACRSLFRRSSSGNKTKMRTTIVMPANVKIALIMFFTSRFGKSKINTEHNKPK
jgi:hypothetical protein